MGERAVAGEGELAAAAGAHRPLIDDAADAVRPGRVADPVQHDLGDRALAVLALGARLVVDRLGEAIERAHPVDRGTARRSRRRTRPGWARSRPGSRHWRRWPRRTGRPGPAAPARRSGRPWRSAAAVPRAARGAGAVAVAAISAEPRTRRGRRRRSAGSGRATPRRRGRGDARVPASLCAGNAPPSTPSAREPPVESSAYVIRGSLARPLFGPSQ